MSRGPAEMALMADTPVPPSVADAPELAAAAQKATPVPRPPGSARSAASSRASVRSAASYRRLHNRAAADKMAELISMKAQLDASSTGRRLGPKAKKKLTSLASREASSLVSSGAVQLEQLPRSVRPGFLTTVKGNSELGATIESAAAKCLGGLTKPQDDGTEKSKMELAPKAKNVELQVKIPVVHSKFQKRLPPVSVAGKREQLETVIRDKIMQRGQGGAHQLRKAFMVFDANGTGEITFAEMDNFLRSINIKVSKHTLHNFFELWAGELTREDLDRGAETMRKTKHRTKLNYMEFIQKILPADYPRRTGYVYADDIGTLAFEDRKKPLTNDEITTVGDFVAAFRDKIAERSGGGGSELQKQYKLLDHDNKGYVVFDDLITASRRWNVKPAPEILPSVRRLWCPQDDGRLSYYDFVNNVLPKDFKDVKEVFRVFHDKISESWSKLGDAFRNMDEDKSGSISTGEVRMLLKKMNINIPPELADEFARAMDTDGDGEIDFNEFSDAIRNMDPDKNPEAGRTGIGMLWDEDPYSKQRQAAHRPISQASVHSEAEIDEAKEERDAMVDTLNKHGVDLHLTNSKVTLTANGDFEVDGVKINLMQVLRDKIYRKKGGIHQIRRAFGALDDDGSGSISRAEFRRFLKPYNLNMTIEALNALVTYFDADQDGLISFNEFAERVMPADYVLLTSKKDPKKKQLQGIPAMVTERGRRVVQPLSPRAMAPFDSKTVVPAPGDMRATNIVREKVAQRTRNVNDNKASLQLRDAFRMYDFKKDGTISVDHFRRVIERYNAFLPDVEFQQLAAKYASPAAPHMVSWGAFLDKVLAKHQVSGAFGPHMTPRPRYGGTTTLRPPSSASARLRSSSPARLRSRGTPLGGPAMPGGAPMALPLPANRPNSAANPRSSVLSGSMMRSGPRPNSARDIRDNALAELSQAMYYTPRAVGPFLSARQSANVTGKVGAPWGGGGATMAAQPTTTMMMASIPAAAFTPKASGGVL